MSLLVSSKPGGLGWLVGASLVILAPFACTPGPRNYAPTDMGGADGTTDGSGATPASVGGNPSGGNEQSGGNGPTGGSAPNSGGADSTGGSAPTGGSGGGSITGPCEDHECENGSACLPDGDDAYTCDCGGTGFEGEFCQTEINECDPSPCEQSANCVDLINDYDCECPDEFAGKNCEYASFEEVPNFTLYDLSADGTMLVGQADLKAARYSDGDFDDLGAYVGHTWAIAYATSADGSIIVGESESSNGSERFAMIWEAGTMDVLETPDGYSKCSANSVSADGNTIVGSCIDTGGANSSVVRWIDREVEVLGTPATTTWCYETLVSGDGASIFASCSDGPNVALMRWTEADGAVLLITPELGCRMYGVTPNGQFGVGACFTTGASTQGFEWAPDDGFDLIEGSEVFEPTPQVTSPSDISADGSIIVGQTGTPGAGTLEPVVWDADRSPTRLTDLLVDREIDTTDWTFGDIDAISGDGTVLVGTGQFESNDRLWILRLD